MRISFEDPALTVSIEFRSAVVADLRPDEKSAVRISYGR